MGRWKKKENARYCLRNKWTKRKGMRVQLYSSDRGQKYVGTFDTVEEAIKRAEELGLTGQKDTIST